MHYIIYFLLTPTKTRFLSAITGYLIEVRCLNHVRIGFSEIL